MRVCLIAGLTCLLSLACFSDVASASRNSRCIIGLRKETFVPNGCGENIEPIEIDLKSEERYAIVIDLGATETRIIPYRIGARGNEDEIPQVTALERFVNNEAFRANLALSPGYGQLEELEVIDAYAGCVRKMTAALFTNEEIIDTTKVIVLVFATSGLRMLSTLKQDSLMAKLRNSLSSAQFIIPNRLSRVLAGSEEARYTWLDANSHLFFKDQQPQSPNVNRSRAESQPLRGIVDVGFGSVQLAFTVSKDVADVDPDSRYFTTTFSSEQYHLYISSFLWLGVESLRQNLHNCLSNKASQFVNKSRSNCEMFASNVCVEPEVAFGNECEERCRRVIESDCVCAFDRAAQPLFGDVKTFVLASELYRTLKTLFGDEKSLDGAHIFSLLEDAYSTSGCLNRMTLTNASNQNQDGQSKCVGYLQAMATLKGLHLNKSGIAMELTNPDDGKGWPRGAVYSYLLTETLDGSTGYSSLQVVSYTVVTFLFGCILALLGYNYSASRNVSCCKPQTLLMEDEMHDMESDMLILSEDSQLDETRE
eukprot:m.177988 g.177988  ORF g.177988 m.177988 type:complete len:537 (-) comp13552_c2_seq2:210-1820(-)